MATEGSIGVGTGTDTNASQNGQNAWSDGGAGQLQLLWNLFSRHLIWQISREHGSTHSAEGSAVRPYRVWLRCGCGRVVFPICALSQFVIAFFCCTFVLLFILSFFLSFFFFVVIPYLFSPSTFADPAFISSCNFSHPALLGLASYPLSSPSRCLSDLRAGRLQLVALCSREERHDRAGPPDLTHCQLWFFNCPQQQHQPPPQSRKPNSRAAQHSGRF